MSKSIPTVRLLDVEISNLRSNEINLSLLNLCKENRKELILNVNIHAMNIAFTTPWFKKMLNEAYINFCDGDGVRLGAKMIGEEIVEKITYNRWIWDLASFSQDNNLSWYMLGSKEGVVDECYELLMKRYPKLNICGYHHGFLKDKETNDLVVSDLQSKKPNILILGMGMPLQEKWLKDNFDDISFNVALTGGAVFDYVSGNSKMTPDIFYKLKLEWFYRFLREPKRLFYRYFIGNPLFFIRILKQRL